MVKKLTLIAIGLASVTVALYAANAWDKPYLTWTEEDELKVNYDSPWGDKRDRDTGVSAKGGNVMQSVTMLWETALPIRQLRARGNPKLADTLDQPTTSHVLHISGLPGSLKDIASDKEKTMAAAVLKVKGKPDIHPIEVQMPAPAMPAGFGGARGGPPGGGKSKFVQEFQRGGGGGGGGGFGGGGAPGGGFGGGGFGGFDLVLVFDKNAPITMDDKEFEFVMTLGKMDIRRKYKLKDMMYNGKLEW